MCMTAVGGWGYLCSSKTSSHLLASRSTYFSYLCRRHIGKYLIVKVGQHIQVKGYLVQLIQMDRRSEDLYIVLSPWPLCTMYARMMYVFLKKKDHNRRNNMRTGIPGVVEVRAKQSNEWLTSDISEWRAQRYAWLWLTKVRPPSMTVHVQGNLLVYPDINSINLLLKLLCT